MPDARGREWRRDELLVCFNLYCRTPFGKLHRNNSDIVQLAESLDRTPSAVAMKLVNFASFDPAHRSRSVRGLANASRLDRAIWDEFNAEPNVLAQKSEEAFERLLSPGEGPNSLEPSIPIGPTELLVTRPMRLVQNFFRRSVSVAYRYSCAFCRLDVLPVLVASHIIWAAETRLRADPRNGVCLCALHDRAFDQGLMCVDEELKLKISARVRSQKHSDAFQVGFEDLAGKPMFLPERFSPYAESLLYHRSRIFR